MTHHIANLLTEALNVIPWWLEAIEDYDGLEVHPVREYPAHETANSSVSNKAFCEICEPHEAHFWSVYGHLKAGHQDCFVDLATEAEAQAFAAGLRELFPHLRDS